MLFFCLPSCNFSLKVKDNRVNEREESMKKLIQRVIIIIPVVAIQILWYVLMFSWLSRFANVINLILTVFSVLFVLYIISARQESTYKTLWLLLILGLPIIGTMLYLLYGNRRTSQGLKRRILASREKLEYELPDRKISDCVEEPRSRATIQYLEKLSGYEMLPAKQAEYYSLGEDAWQGMLKDLSEAKQYIFAEYFIIEPGEMWDSMVDIMAEKVNEGVDVRVMFDDLGSVTTYSKANIKHLLDLGIKCMPFNEIKLISGSINNRDHRKMLIIDGEIAYSGGINIADEYINRREKYGHWKDIAFRITGEGVKNYLRMFMEFWNAFHPEKISNELLEFYHQNPLSLPETSEKGYILSYYDSPFNENEISNNVYVELLEQSTRRAWFYTPYLMLGDTLRDAFIRAAERGVDVRLIVPGIPDKKIVYRMSQANYNLLLNAGVRIFEYTPGFVHAKATIFDDNICTIGTVNLDYRSLFLHFENNSLFYQNEIITDLESDFIATQQKCVERTKENWKRGALRILFDGVLMVFAPLC